MRVFIDANILFSASARGSATRMLFEGLSESGEVLSNEHAVEEARRNLQRKRPKWSDGLEELLEFVQISNAFSKSLSVDLPQEDYPILAGAVGANCTHLWTGDKRHFGKYYGKSVDTVLIISGIMLADILLEMGWKIT